MHQKPRVAGAKKGEFAGGHLYILAKPFLALRLAKREYNFRKKREVRA